MRRKRNLTRRKFIQIAAAAAASAPAVSCTGTRSPWRFFTVEEARTLEAICDCIIPDDQDSGAVRAGVVNFIDRQLVGHYRRHQKDYRQGIAGVDETSRTLHNKIFGELPFEQRTQLLAAMEKNEAVGETWKQLPARDFFDLILRHTMQGFYGDPRHGGNREGASWKMVGLSYPPVRGRLHYDLSKREGT